MKKKKKKLTNVTSVAKQTILIFLNKTLTLRVVVVLNPTTKIDKKRDIFPFKNIFKSKDLRHA